MSMNMQHDKQASFSKVKWPVGLALVGIAAFGILSAPPDRKPTKTVSAESTQTPQSGMSGRSDRSANTPMKQESAVDKARSPDEAVAPAALARARRALESALPEWDRDINVTPAELEGKQFDPSKYDALELAKRVTNEHFELSEIRENGRTVYKSADQESTVKNNDRLGYWKFIGPMKEPKGEVKISDAEAAAKTEQLLSDFELPEGEVGEVRAAGIAGMARGEEQPQIVGRHVRVSREINGIAVDESTLMVSYDSEGNVMRAERRWPAFALSGEEVASREQALSDLAQDLESDFAQDDSLQAGATLRYTVNEKTGVHEPVLRVQVRSDENHGRTLDYSLVQRGEPSVPAGDDQDG